jgi:FlaA1/EpsC-like NDP-sugar epimerase
MITYIRNRYLFVSDFLLLTTAAYVSFVLRLETPVLHSPYWHGLLLFLVVAIPFVLGMFHQTGVYARYWQYASIEEMVLLAGSVTIATVISGGITLAIDWWLLSKGTVTIPRSIPLIFMLLALCVTATPRLALRLFSHRQGKASRERHLTPVLVVGAGRSGTLIIREIQHNPSLGMRVVGFVDDDPGKQRLKIYGFPVLGRLDDIARLVQEYGIQQVIIAMPTAPGKTIRDIVRRCEDVHVQTRTMPGMSELLDGRVSVNQLRPVQIEDLLRREPVQTDIEAVRELVRGKRVLITGSGGSIGSELCRQVFRCEPAELVLLGHGENSVFAIHNELARAKSSIVLHPVIADIRFPERLHRIFQTCRPDIVFHAAAHKHVPLMERNPAEAITNNVLGTHNLLQVSLAHDVERFVMISSDKAVNPTSVMGATKRVAELLVHQTARASGKPYVAVRFGNVLGSRGSVVLTFKEQIAAGGPVTVTHPEMCRYFMTIPESVQLVLQAAVMGRGGEVFMLDMGEPVKIADLARDMIELSGLEVGEDIDIEFTGMRPGEKLFEELCIRGECYQGTAHSKIAVVVNAGLLKEQALHANGVETPSSLASLDTALQCLVRAATEDNHTAIVEILQRIVPEYTPMSQCHSKNGVDVRPSSVNGVERVVPKTGRLHGFCNVAAPK